MGLAHVFPTFTEMAAQVPLILTYSTCAILCFFTISVSKTCGSADSSSDSVKGSLEPPLNLKHVLCIFYQDSVKV